MGSNMKYAICGIDRTTGLQITRMIDAPDHLTAESLASRSMVVFDVEPADSPQGRDRDVARLSTTTLPTISESVRRLAFTLCLLILAGLLGWSEHEKTLDQQRIASAAHHGLAITPKLAIGPPEFTRPDHSNAGRPPSAPAVAPHPSLHAPHAGSSTTAAKTA